MGKVISIFGSSRPGEGDELYRLAYDVGFQLARSGFTICNGGYGGIMEASARGAREAGGATIGITVEAFPRSANRWIEKETRTKSLVERLEQLVNSADGYVILRGGTGTLLELAYVWEIINKGLMREKPIVLVGPFWNGVIETLREESMLEGSGNSVRFFHVVKTAEECAAIFRTKLMS